MSADRIGSPRNVDVVREQHFSGYILVDLHQAAIVAEHQPQCIQRLGVIQLLRSQESISQRSLAEVENRLEPPATTNAALCDLHDHPPKGDLRGSADRQS